MKAKKVAFLSISFILIAVVLVALKNMLGVSLEGPNLGQATFMVLVGMAGVVLWEFWESVL